MIAGIKFLQLTLHKYDVRPYFFRKISGWVDKYEADALVDLVRGFHRNMTIQNRAVIAADSGFGVIHN